MSTPTVLEVNRLKRYFPIRGGLLQRQVATVQAVDDISFAVERGETLGIVGESGCATSTTARLLIQLLEADSGTITLDGRIIGDSSGLTMRDYRRQLQMVFQDSYSSLNPAADQDTCLAPTAHGVVVGRGPQTCDELLDKVGSIHLFAARDPTSVRRPGGARQPRSGAIARAALIGRRAFSERDKSAKPRC